MKTWIVVLGVLLLQVGPAQGLVIGASGSVAISVATLDPVVASGASTVTVNGSAGAPGGHLESLVIPGSVFSTTGLLVDSTDPAASPIRGQVATFQNATLSLAEAGGGGPLLGVGALFGVTKICLFGDCSGFVPANLSIPLSVVGVGGTATVSNAINVSVVGAPWTTGSVNIGSVTQMGFAHGAASGTSSTASASGVISLVSPVFVSTNISSIPTLPVFARLSVHIVPEPSTLLLCAAGVLGLAAAGRQRLRR